MKFCHALIALCAVSVAGVVSAEEFKHKATGLKFAVPAGWECKQTGDEILITNSDKTLSVAGGVIPKDTAKAIFADMEKFLASLDGLSDVKILAGPEKEEEDGLEQSWYEGTANFKNDKGETEKIEWDMTIVSGGKEILFLIGLGKLDDNEDVYEEFFTSIEKSDDDEE